MPKLLPQLRMRHPLIALPARRELPEGYRLRVATREDAEGIANVLESAFNEPWNSERVFADLLDDPGVPLTFVIERDGVIVATASYQEKEEPDPSAGWLHWVGVHPDSRGLRLGEIVSHEVISEATSRRRSCVLLTTDDFRVPAIRTYLRLGFEPDNCHENHEGRWIAILQALPSP